MLNIIMYHYVRNNEEFEYNCFSRRKSEFENQVEYFSRKSTIVNPLDFEQIRFYIDRNDKNGFLLTFDDGYKDHLFCAEYLFSKNLSAIFFPPINIQKELLDVNAIHYLIGQKDLNLQKLLEFIVLKIKSRNLKISIDARKIISIEEYLEQKLEDKYGSKIEIILIKKLLQKDIIGVSNRKKILEEAILYFVKKDSKSLVNEFYLSLKDMISMKQMGMFFGSHGLTHQWLHTLSYDEQYKEINESFNELIKMKVLDINSPKVFCYPYGSYNNITLDIIKKLDINICMTTKLGAASKGNNSLLELNRWNTNNCWDNYWNKPIFPYE